MNEELSDTNKVKKLTEYFEKHEDVVMAFLFGSRAGGQIRKKSDWDIGVYFKPIMEAVEWEEHGREYLAELEVWSDCVRILNTDAVDLIVLNRAPADISDRAIQGIPLVLKDYNLWRKFMLIISREAEDYRQFVHEYYMIAQRSASLSARDRSEFEKIIQFLDAELSRYDHFSKMTGGEYENDVVKRNDVERWIEKIITATIDIAKITLSSQKKPIPDTYRENLIRASLFFNLSEEFTRKFESWVKLRNVLAHEYLDIKWKKISNFIETSEPYFRSFLDSAKKFLENENGDKS